LPNKREQSPGENRKTCDHIETALGPDKVIPGGRYSLDLAVEVASQKYIEHMPLERHGIFHAIRSDKGTQTCSAILKNYEGVVIGDQAQTPLGYALRRPEISGRTDLSICWMLHPRA